MNLSRHYLSKGKVKRTRRVSPVLDFAPELLVQTQDRRKDTSFAHRMQYKLRCTVGILFENCVCAFV